MLWKVCVIFTLRIFIFEFTFNFLGIPEEIPPSDASQDEMVVMTPKPRDKLVRKHQVHQPKHSQVYLDSSEDDIPLRNIIKTISQDHVLLRTPSRHARGQSSRDQHVSLDSSSQSSSSNLLHEPTSSWSNLICESTPSSTLPLPSLPNQSLSVMKERLKRLPLADHSIFFTDLNQARKGFQPNHIDSSLIRHCLRQLAIVGVFPDTEWLLTMATPKIKARVLKVSELLLKYLEKKESSVIKGDITLDRVKALKKALKSYKAALIK